MMVMSHSTRDFIISSVEEADVVKTLGNMFKRDHDDDDDDDEVVEEVGVPSAGPSLAPSLLSVELASTSFLTAS